MISLVRNGSIDVYCECIVEDDGENLRGIETSHGESSHNEGGNNVVKVVDHTVDYERLHDDEEFERECMPQNETSLIAITTVSS